MKPKLKVIKPKKRTELHGSVINMANSIGPKDKAVVFAVLKKDGSVVTGASYVAGFARTDLFGMAECMKMDLFEQIWCGE
jgi:hypothetical protein